MFNHILIAFDGSDHARRAARISGDMARLQADPQLRLVCALEPLPTELGKPFIDELITERNQIGTILLKQACDLIGSGVEVHEELIYGSPAESILRVASSHECDLIIMGTRGLSGLRGLLLGSQIQKVISLSEVPVLAVK